MGIAIDDATTGQEKLKFVAKHVPEFKKYDGAFYESLLASEQHAIGEAFNKAKSNVIVRKAPPKIEESAPVEAVTEVAPEQEEKKSFFGKDKKKK